MREADKDGRYPLTGREYEAMRTLWGAMNALQGDDLKARLQTTKDGWKALKTAEAFMQKAIEALNMTIPLNKLLTLQRELKETVCIVRLRGASYVSQRDSVFVSQPALVRLLDRAIQMDCMLCEKTRKEGAKCRLYRDIAACFPYELENPNEEDKCPFAGINHITYQGDNE